MYAAVAHSQRSAIETETTDTTDTTDDSCVNVVTCVMDPNDTITAVSNEEFLLTVFGSELVQACPIVLSFEGNPASAPSRAWFDKSWINDSDMTNSLPADAKNYFRLAIFRPDEAGQYRRQKARFHALYAVMFDDAGT